eukprot:jgi/Botrbrau1/9184/Bobra.0236s0015.1
MQRGTQRDIEGLSEEELRAKIAEVIKQARLTYTVHRNKETAKLLRDVLRQISSKVKTQCDAGPRFATRRSVGFKRFADSAKLLAKDGPTVARTLQRQGLVEEPFAALEIPPSTPLPLYKSWGYLLQNELAQEVGRRQFYTDAPTGETIPASDFEAEGHTGDEVLSGAFWEREDFVLIELSRNFPTTPRVLSVISKLLDASKEKLEARMREAIRLAEGRPGAAQADAAPSEFASS